MTFKLAMSETFWARVKAEVQTENGDRRPVEFRVKYKRLDVDEAQEYQARAVKKMQEYVETRDGTSSAMMTDLLMEVVEDWDGIIDENDAKAEFTRDGLHRLVKLGLGSAVYKAFSDAAPKAREKN